MTQLRDQPFHTPVAATVWVMFAKPYVAASKAGLRSAWARAGRSGVGTMPFKMPGSHAAIQA
jgi:hypothetical protein